MGYVEDTVGSVINAVNLRVFLSEYFVIVLLYFIKCLIFLNIFCEYPGLRRLRP
jgi:hypothetical protein